ncbi:Na(+)/H(+) exchanger protein 7-like [Panonychus citri]|uniref:Na(+)/H(+) exchanger protein 7-like n=1 Tax=Panonychus citri TaxID=50023 RepID=UPI00230771E8|nr:Na(+)/H(+) exchanger protein 7-like [Panonychus citri]
MLSNFIVYLFVMIRLLFVIIAFPLAVNSVDQSLVGHNSSRRGVVITLIGWRWDTIGPYLVVVIFFILGAFAKLSYHNTHWLRTQIPESCVLILLGSCVGLILHLADIPGSTYIPQFTPEKFFYFYLPPIILESAYELFDKTFFKNIGTIMLLAVVGTIINIIGIGISIYLCSNFGLYLPFRLNFIECLTFSTLISAVDPVAVIAIFQEVNVDKALYFLVFGESLLNDAVVVTMYNTMTTFAASSGISLYHVFLAFLSFITVSGGGIIIGIIFGGFTSFITKYTSQVRVIEPLIVILCAYLSYFTAELLHFSGIICLTCCGLIQAAYARHNISSKSNITIKYFVKTLSSISEVIIFLFLGMILIRDIHTWNCNFIVSLLIFCIIYRFASIYFLTYICNTFSNRLRSITRQEQFIMAYGGLRGAIAFALAIMLHPKDIPSYELFITATMAVIIFTVFVQGSTTKPIVRLLGLQMLTDADPKLFNELHSKVIETAMSGIDDILSLSGAGTFIMKNLHNVNKSAERLLIKDYTDRWTAVRHTMNRIELNQAKSIFTMVRSIPDKWSASELGTLDRNIGLFERKLPKMSKPIVPITKLNLNTGSDQSNNSNHSVHSHHSHISDRYPHAHPHSHPISSLNQSKQQQSNRQFDKTHRKIIINNKSVNPKPNGVTSPFVGYQGRVTYIKPNEHLVDQQLTKNSQQLTDQKGKLSTGKILNSRFSSDSNINNFREALNETFNSNPESIEDNQSESSEKSTNKKSKPKSNN